MTRTDITHSAILAGVHNLVILEETGDRCLRPTMSASAGRFRTVRHRVRMLRSDWVVRA